MVNSNKLALIIGIDSYYYNGSDGKPSLPPLHSCKKDAQDLYNLLSSVEYGYKVFGNEPIIGSNLEKEEGWLKVHRSIKKFFNNAEPGQTLLFYFSGHGIPRGDEVYLATPQVDPKDPMIEGFPLSTLTKIIESSKSARIVCIIDACYSGAANLPSSSWIDKDAAEGDSQLALATYDKILDIPKAEGKCLLLSSQAYEKSRAIENSNSLYTKYLIEGLRGTKATLDDRGREIPASVDGNGNVTPESLHEYVYQKVANEANQVPKIKSDKSGRIIIATHPQLVQKQRRVAESETADAFAKLIERERESSNFASENEQLAAITLDDVVWEYLLERIKKEKCSAFIGWRACVPTLPSELDIAERWAEEDRSYHFYDYSNLPKIAQSMALKHGEMYPKNKLIDLFKKAKLPDFSRSDEPHAVLADLNLPLYITSNYDDFMVQCLLSRGRQPIQESLRWNTLSEVTGEKAYNEDKSFEPTKDIPLVYHLCGHIKTPQSIVLTESDYKDYDEFIVHSSYDNSVNFLPHSMRLTMINNVLLFVGYTVEDWKFEALLNWINSFMFIRRSTYLKVLVHPFPKSKSYKEQEQELQERFEKKKLGQVSIYWGSVQDFVHELRERWNKYK